MKVAALRSDNEFDTLTIFKKTKIFLKTLSDQLTVYLPEVEKKKVPKIFK